MTDDNMRQISFGENDYRNMLITELRRTGGDPSQLFEILEAIVEARAWEFLTDTNGEPVGTLRRLVAEPPPVGAGMPAEKVLRLLEVEHRYEHANKDWQDRMAALRDAVRRELGAEPLAKHGGDRRSENNQVRNTNLKTQTDTSSYKLARLQRDRPDLAEKVLDGELSAHAAAVEAGFANPKVAINPRNLESAANTICRKLDRDEVLELIDWLYKTVDK